MKIYNYIFLLLLLCAQPISAHSNADRKCDQHIAFISAFYNGISNANKSPEQRYETISAILENAIDIENISKSVMGPHWNKISYEKQQEFQSVYKQYLVKYFANIIIKYFGKMEVTNSKKIKHLDGYITTITVTYKDKPFYVSCFTVKRNNSIYIFDMALEKIRTIVMQRDEFRAKMHNSDIDGLITSLRDDL